MEPDSKKGFGEDVVMRPDVDCIVSTPKTHVLCRKLNCARCHLPAALQCCSSPQHALPHGELAAVEEGTLCSRSTLYILWIHCPSLVLHSFCVLCLIIKYIFTIAAFLFIVKKTGSE